MLPMGWKHMTNGNKNTFLEEANVINISWNYSFIPLVVFKGKIF